MGIRNMASSICRPSTLSWTASHPERSKPQLDWNDNDWGIHMADAIAGSSDCATTAGDLTVLHCNAEDLYAALTPQGTWQWMDGTTIFHGSLRQRALHYHFGQYTKKRDMKHIYANEPIRWSKYSIPLLATLTKTSHKSPRQIGRRSKHIFDWMAHGTNLAKGATPYTRISKSLCQFCGEPETQQHINAACTHPPLVETRRSFRRQIDEFFLCCRHQHFPPADRWILPFLDHMEANVWNDNVASGDLWNGRWSIDLIHSLLEDSADTCIPPKALTRSLKWLQTLTGLLQRTQRAIHATRRAELSSLEASQRHATVVALRRRRTTNRTQTLFAAWNIPYQPSATTRRRGTPAMNQLPLPQLPLSTRLTAIADRWIQHSKARRCPIGQTPSHPPRLHRRIAKTSKREDHRTRQLKLRKLRNFLLHCR